jgi:uncharacterized protein (TIGR03437 family)
MILRASGLLLLVSAMPTAAQSISVMPAATLTRGGAVAPDSIASLFGQGLATRTEAALGVALPVELAGTTVAVTDSRNNSHRASLFYVSPAQINLVVPAQAAAGAATVTVRSADGRTATGTVEISAVAPGIFAANGGGQGVAAALALRVAVNGDRTTVPVARFDSDRRVFVADPVDLGAQGDEVYLLLFGSGLRSARAVTAVLAGSSIPVLGFSAQAETAGLDQVNIGPVPVSLAGRADAEIQITADGVRSNSVTAAFRSRGLSPAEGQWGTRAPLLEPNSEMGVAELAGRIYVIGGYPASRVSVRTVQVYDPANDAWSLTSPLPVALNHLMPAVANGKLYVIGGQTDANVAYVNTMYEYDPATAEWRTRSPMPTARSAGAAVTIGGKIYVAGGRPPRGADFAVYDPAADRWETLPNLPTQRNHLIALAADGKMYVVGGRFEGGFTSPQSDAMEVYDPVTGRWSSRAAMPKPRGGINGVVANGCIHVFGGEGSATDPNGVYPDHDLYDPVTDRWSSVGRLPIPVHGVTGAAFLGGLIHLPGGGTSQGGSSGGLQHQVYRPNQSCR